MLSDNGFRMGASPYQLACLLQVNPGLHKGSEVSEVFNPSSISCLSKANNCFFLVL